MRVEPRVNKEYVAANSILNFIFKRYNYNRTRQTPADNTYVRDMSKVLKTKFKYLVRKQPLINIHPKCQLRANLCVKTFLKPVQVRQPGDSY